MLAPAAGNGKATINARPHEYCIQRGETFSGWFPRPPKLPMSQMRAGRGSPGFPVVFKCAIPNLFEVLFPAGLR